MEERAQARQKGLGYRVERTVLDEESLEEVAQRQTHEDKPALAQRLRGKLSCSAVKLRHCLFTCIPVLSWLPCYSFRECALADLFAGISVGIMHLPQGMAYALLSSLPPVFGLYSSFYPVLVYFIFGTSRHISIGTFAVMSMMVSSVTERLAPDSMFLLSPGNLTNATGIDTEARDAMRVQVATATTILAGLFQVALGLVQFGFVVTYLSDPLVRGYTTAAATIAMVSQLKYMLGVHSDRFSGPLSFVYTLIDVCFLLPETNLGTLVVSIVSLVVLAAGKELNTAWSHKLPMPIPIELITIVLATVISGQATLSPSYGVDVVGEIPSGLKPPSLPDCNLFGQVIGDAFAQAIVGYAVCISLGKTFAMKYGYKVDNNQELVALGLSNACGGLFQCFTVSCSMSRSLIQESTGGKTQVAGVISSIIVLVTVLKLGVLFQELPKTVLSAIMFINLKGMFKQYSDIVTLWRTSKIDLLVWVMTLVFTLLLNLDLGLAASIAFAMLTVIFRTQLPRYSVLGQIPGTELYLDVKTFKQAREIPGITIFRSSTTLYFANADLFLEALKKKVGIDIAQLLTYKKKLAAKEKRREKRQERRAKETKKMVDDTLSRDLERVSVGSLGKWSWDIHSIILDLSTVNFTDTMAIKTLRNICHDFREIEVDVYLAGCQPCVVEELERGLFFSKMLTKAHLFASVHDAVLHCGDHRGSPCPPHHCDRDIGCSTKL
ncbi:solute carrier family 26 member 6-like [Acipenser ruthenus]|uniref:solute carrier family 26 member 6-like n=1 Tax=Acipenser ruthenus TaxID=7906 RepID=UPI0027410544|nr:solute carrier family 26 member 6-like [Acipenser ruthenus]